MHADRAHDLQHEYARAEALEVEVERLRAALAEALDPDTEWTPETWARLLAIRDGVAVGQDAS
jgi:hypothetical protein